MTQIRFQNVTTADPRSSTPKWVAEVNQKIDPKLGRDFASLRGAQLARKLRCNWRSTGRKSAGHSFSGRHAPSDGGVVVRIVFRNFRKCPKKFGNLRRRVRRRSSSTNRSNLDSKICTPCGARFWSKKGAKNWIPKSVPKSINFRWQIAMPILVVRSGPNHGPGSCTWLWTTSVTSF